VNLFAPFAFLLLFALFEKLKEKEKSEKKIGKVETSKKASFRVFASASSLSPWECGDCSSAQSSCPE
jgi:hypothetical protein